MEDENFVPPPQEAQIYIMIALWLPVYLGAWIACIIMLVNMAFYVHWYVTHMISILTIAFMALLVSECNGSPAAEFNYRIRIFIKLALDVFYVAMFFENMKIFCTFDTSVKLTVVITIAQLLMDFYAIKKYRTIFIGSKKTNKSILR